jgi:hypothetical protein
MDNITSLLLVLSIICLIFGLRYLFSYLVAKRRYQAGLTWQEATGAVNGYQVVEEKANPGRSGSSARWYIDLQYTYSVMGTDYPCLVSLNQPYPSEAAAREAAEATPKGSPVPVRYNPKKPQVHMGKEDLQPPPSPRTALLLLAAGVGFLLLAML